MASMTQFIAVVVIAVLVSSAVAAGISMVIPGPEGPEGPPGPEGPEGPPGSFFAPDYDSGWVELGYGWIYFEHSLGTTNIFVYVLGSDEGPEVDSHQIYYGVNSITISGVKTENGLLWSTDGTYVKLMRAPDDEYWNYARILIWELPPRP